MMFRQLAAAFLLLFSSIAAFASLPDDMKGTLLVVSKTDNSVSFIDLVSGKTVATLPTGKGPHELVVSDDGLWAVVSDFVGGDSLTIIDVANRRVARTISLKKYPRPHGIQFLADQTKIAATSGATNAIVIADIHTGEVIRGIDTTQSGTHMLAIDREKHLAYSSNMRSNSIAVLDLRGGKFVKAIATAQTPEAIRLNGSGNEIWYGANRRGLIKVVNVEDGKELAEWKGFKFPYRVLFSRDDRIAVVPDFRQDYIRFFDAQNKTELGTLELGKDAGPQGVILHPDDNTLFLSLNRKHKVVAIDIHKRKIIAEFDSGLNPDGIGYSPMQFSL